MSTRAVLFYTIKACETQNDGLRWTELKPGPKSFTLFTGHPVHISIASKTGECKSVFLQTYKVSPHACTHLVFLWFPFYVSFVLKERGSEKQEKRKSGDLLLNPVWRHQKMCTGACKWSKQGYIHPRRTASLQFGCFNLHPWTPSCQQLL